MRGAAQRGMIDYFALPCSVDTKVYGLQPSLREYHLDFDEINMPAMGMHLIFVRAPNGVLVELGFPL